jgi:hypothetical protein
MWMHACVNDCSSSASLAGTRMHVSSTLGKLFSTLQARACGPKAVECTTTMVKCLDGCKVVLAGICFQFLFHKLIMEKVVFPTAREFTWATFFAWIDDLVLAADSLDSLVAVLLFVLDVTLAFCVWVSLAECLFLNKSRES